LDVTDVGTKEARWEKDVPDVSVVVCTYRRWESLGRCLAALRAQTVPAARREIIVVDNGQDDVARAAFAWPDDVRMIVAGQVGLSHARNLGVAAARGAIIGFVDDDAAAAPDWLASILRAFSVDSGAGESVLGERGIGAVGGRVVPVWPAPRPNWLDAWHEGFLSIVDLGPSPRALEDREWLAGTNIAFRADALAQAGPFAEHLGRFPGVLLGNEEIALLARLRARGWSVRYDPWITVEHHIHAERLTQAWLRRRIAWQAIADLLLDTPATDDVPTLWHRVAAYFERLPPAYRGPVGLLRDTADPLLFRAQGEAIEAFVRLLAAHGADVERVVLGAAA
jgi:glycosyltransferase involved in cell wall biosynthesis